MKDVMINNLLCFLSSAQNDFPNEVFYDQIFSFYSIEDIKTARELLSSYVTKSFPARRGPDKKKRELDDLLESYHEFETLKTRVVFASDSYKKMPPLGLEFIAPILTTLIEEVTKLNSMLPKFTDLKSEVINTADIMRSLKTDIKVIDSKVNSRSTVNASTHVDEQRLLPVNTNEIGHSTSIHVGSNINEVSQSSITPQSHKTSQQCNSNRIMSHSRSNKIIELQKNIFGTIGKNEIVNNFSSDHEASPPHVAVRSPKNSSLEVAGSSSEISQINSLNSPKTPSLNESSMKTSIGDATHGVGDAEESTTQQSYQNSAQDWTEVNNKKKKNTTRKTPALITGSLINSNLSFKGIKKSIDVFIGRVDINSTTDDLEKYILSTFNIKTIKIDKLNIKSQLFNCFKVRILLKDRDALFNPDLWPESIIVNKFFNRKSDK